MATSTRKVLATPTSGSPSRLLFIDALRGFDMFWITGGDVDARARAISEWTERPDLVSLNLSEDGWRELATLPFPEADAELVALLTQGTSDQE